MRNMRNVYVIYSNKVTGPCFMELKAARNF